MAEIVSVIIPSYNVSGFIREAIESVLIQTHQDFEIIVVDDCSSDNTVEIVKAYQDPRIRVSVNEKNQGPSFSRNRAIELAKGDWIAILDSDDWWERERLEKLLSTADYFQADIVCDNLYWILDGEQEPWTTHFKEKKIGVVKPDKVPITTAIKEDFGILKPIFKKDFLNSSSVRYNNQVSYGEDFLFLIECLIKGAVLAVIPDALYYYRIRKGSLVSNKVKLLKQTIANTKQVMENPTVQKMPEVLKELKHRKKEHEEALDYFELIEPFKNGKVVEGLKVVLTRPHLALTIPKRVPQIIKYRLLKYFN